MNIQEISIFILPLKEITELMNQRATRLVNFEMKFQSWQYKTSFVEVIINILAQRLVLEKRPEDTSRM